MARRVTPVGDDAGVRLSSLADRSEVGLANRSEGLGWPGHVDKSERFRCAVLAQCLGPLDKSEGSGDWAGPGLVDGQAGQAGWASWAGWAD